MIRKFWTFRSDKPRIGRPPVPASIKLLILDMNSIAERFIGSLRRELLDNFIIISENQLYYLLRTYIEHYNTKRPHQGIGQSVPKGYDIRSIGEIRSKPILFGLNYEYFREAA